MAGLGAMEVANSGFLGIVDSASKGGSERMTISIDVSSELLATGGGTFEVGLDLTVESIDALFWGLAAAA